uniref:Coiled-coil domain-containing protein 86 n=1 Tax=Caenorhabditis tropicalis TaxID=1561998 RepID=A0A1I7TQ24_9PELO
MGDDTRRGDIIQVMSDDQKVGMSLKRGEGEQPQAVAVAENKKEDVVLGMMALSFEILKGLNLESEDVRPGQRRRGRRHAAGGKMRLRGKLGGRKIRRSPEEAEKKAAERQVRKLERAQLALAKKLSRAELRKTRRGDERSRSVESTRSRKVSKSRSESAKSPRRVKKSRSESGKPDRSPRRFKKNRSESRSRKEKAPGFIRKRRESKRVRSESKEARKLERAEKKLAREQAREEKRAAKAVAEIHVTGVFEEPKTKKRSSKPKNPYREKIRYGKLVHAPAAFKSMRRAVQRR